MEIKQTMKKYNYGIFGYRRKLPQVWKKKLLVFNTYNQALNFWINNNMAFGCNKRVNTLTIHEIINGHKKRSILWPNNKD